MRIGIAAALAAAACACVATAPSTAAAAVRTHYIASDEVLWNYAPSGRDLITGKALPPLPKLALGFKFHKVVYREYTDATFAKRVVRPGDAYLGLLGPPIHAEVGDTIVIVFKNNAPIPTDITASGVSAGHASPVPPGRTARVEWRVTDSAGPATADGSSIAWRYYSDVDENADENTGMIGPLVITRRGAAKADGSPADVDREVYSLFSQMDEFSSRLLAANVADPVTNPRHIKPQPLGSEFYFDNHYFTIDGFIFGNMPMPVLHVGERTRWYVVVTRSDFDAHVPHWHGLTVLEHGMRMDAIDAEPDQTIPVDMVPDDVGIWLFHCHVAVHLALGMEARYSVVR